MTAKSDALKLRQIHALEEIGSALTEIAKRLPDPKPAPDEPTIDDRSIADPAPRWLTEGGVEPMNETDV